MTMKKKTTIFIAFALFFGAFVSPWLLLNKKINSIEWDEKAYGNIGLIFGTRVTGQKVSPLLKERLEMAIRFYEGGKVETLVVSNTEQASHVMRDYLLSRGVLNDDIVLDINAVITRDSCKSKIVQENKNSVLFFSQSFHLPRISYECEKLGVSGGLHPLVPAERIRHYDNFMVEPQIHFEDDKLSTAQVTYIRVKRHLREMTILWADIIFQKVIF